MRVVRGTLALAAWLLVAAPLPVFGVLQDPELGVYMPNIAQDAPLFSDHTTRLGTCQDDILGQHSALNFSTEYHLTKQSWDFMQPMSCDWGGCRFSASDKAYVCPASNDTDGFPKMRCECEQCPCPEGRKGFMCSQCSNNLACPNGTSCQTSTAISWKQVKTYSCEFDITDPLYRLMFTPGMATPIAMVEWNPTAGTSQVNVIHSMCMDTQPILMQCPCTGCKQQRDTQDAVTGEISGPCKDKNLPSPCGRCEKCHCDIPPNSPASSLVKGVLEVIQAGSVVSCEPTGADGLSTCMLLLDDLPITLTIKCGVSYCAAKADEPYPEDAGQTSWITQALTGLIIIWAFAVLVGVWTFVVRICSWRLAATAGSCPPRLDSNKEHPLTLSWHGVRCIRGGRPCLDGDSGSVRADSTTPGKLVAVTGPSGRGKTTLLNFLSGRGFPGDVGEVRINDMKMTPAKLRRHVGYVPQHEVLGVTLTVRENLEFSAALRLPGLSARQRAGRVNWALDRLNLQAVARSRVGEVGARGISGGERRRTAIASELIVAPAIMVLDEPATGLDAAAALELGKMLAELAEEGRVIMCSVHQPRPELLRIFHEHIDLGAEPAAEPVAKPAELASPSCQEPAEDNTGTTASSSNENVAANDASDSQQDESPETPAPPRSKVPLPPAIRTTIFPFQVIALWRRSLTEASRGSRRCLWGAVVSLVLGVFIGIVFNNIGIDIVGVQQRFGSIFFAQLFFGFCGMEIVPLWYWDRPRLHHESLGGFYSRSAYFVAKASAYLFWFCMVCPALFVGTSYPLIKYSVAIDKGVFHYLALCGAAAGAGGISLFIVSLTNSLGVGVSTSAIVLTILLMYTGFLTPQEHMPDAVLWILKISPFSHSFRGMITNDLLGLDTKFSAEGIADAGIKGDLWLIQWDIEPDGIHDSAVWLGVIISIIWFCAFLAVVVRWPDLMEHAACRKVSPESAIRVAPVGGLDNLVGASTVKRTLTWEDLKVALPTGRQVLNGNSGHATAGEPLAVLGPSGCGKSTLLNYIAGDAAGCRNLRTRGSGPVAIDGVPLFSGQRSRLIGFVQQDDALHGSLTVREVLSFAAALRLWTTSPKDRERRVDHVLERLGLQTVSDSYLGYGASKRSAGASSGGVSGGERRRTAVGVELVAARQVLLLDEPTSGLDASGATALCRLLSELAMGQRVVMATIHQPQPEVLAHFAQVLVMAHGGVIVYHGPRAKLDAFVAAAPGGLVAPTAADQVLDSIAAGGAAAFAEVYRSSEAAAACRSVIAEANRRGPDNKVEVAAAVPKVPPIYKQMKHLFQREMRLIWREPGLAPSHFVSALLAGLLLGLTYYDMQLNLAGVISRVGLFFAVQCILAMQALQNFLAWRDGYTCFVREHASGYYGTGAYVMTKALADAFVLRIGPPLMLGLCMYHLANLKMGGEAAFHGCLCLAALASSACCAAMGALAPRSAVGLPLAVLVLLVFLLFGGVMLRATPRGVAALSLFRASYQLLVKNEFIDQVFEFDPKGVSAEFAPVSGERWMKLLAFDVNEEQGWQAATLLGWWVVYTGLAWVFLALRVTRWECSCTCPRRLSAPAPVEVVGPPVLPDA